MRVRGASQAAGSRLLLAPVLRDARRTVARAMGADQRLWWSHRADDPYSFLLAQVLADQPAPGGQARRPGIEGLTVAPAPASAMPHPDLWQSYALEDARALAARFGLIPPGDQPHPEQVARAHGRLLTAEGGPNYVEIAAAVGERLWSGDALDPSPLPAAVIERRLANNRWRLERGGHYASGMLAIAGAWFWGLDRLDELNDELQRLGHAGFRAPEARPVSATVDPHAPVEMFFSVRSPYSYLALEQIDAVVERVGRPLVERPVLPMVARGMEVQLNKKLYIMLDANREARRHGIPFGPVVDPLGAAVERTLAVHVHLARSGRRDLAARFIRSAMRGIWAEGADVARDAPLRRVAGRADVAWSTVADALGDASWREVVEANRRELETIGLWGVPSFRVGDMHTWGRDRLWRVDGTALRG